MYLQPASMLSGICLYLKCHNIVYLLPCCFDSVHMRGSFCCKLFPFRPSEKFLSHFLSASACITFATSGYSMCQLTLKGNT